MEKKILLILVACLTYVASFAYTITCTKPISGYGHDSVVIVSDNQKFQISYNGVDFEGINENDVAIVINNFTKAEFEGNETLEDAAYINNHYHTSIKSVTHLVIKNAHIGQSVFGGWENLKRIDISGENTKIDNNAFNGNVSSNAVDVFVSEDVVADSIAVGAWTAEIASQGSEIWRLHYDGYLKRKPYNVECGDYSQNNCVDYYNGSVFACNTNGQHTHDWSQDKPQNGLEQFIYRFKYEFTDSLAMRSFSCREGFSVKVRNNVKAYIVLGRENEKIKVQKIDEGEDIGNECFKYGVLLSSDRFNEENLLDNKFIGQNCLEIKKRDDNANNSDIYDSKGKNILIPVKKNGTITTKNGDESVNLVFNRYYTTANADKSKSDYYGFFSAINGSTVYNTTAYISVKQANDYQGLIGEDGNAAAKLLIVSGGDDEINSGIFGIDNEKNTNDGEYYTLSGVAVSTPIPNHIYIKNHKKILYK